MVSGTPCAPAAYLQFSFVPYRIDVRVSKSDNLISSTAADYIYILRMYQLPGMLYTHGKYFHSECYWGATSDTFLMCFGRLHSTNKFYKVFFSRIYTTSSRYVFSGRKHALRKTAYLPSRTGVWQAYYLTLKPMFTQTLTFSYTCPRSVRCILHPGKRFRKEIMRPARPLHSMVLG